MKDASLVEKLRQRREYLRILQKEVGKLLEDVPPGTLIIDVYRGNARYFHRRTGQDRKGKYIPRAQHDLVTALAQKDYNQRLQKSVSMEIRAVSSFLRFFPKVTPEEVYEQLSDQRKKLVSPLVESEKVKRERWADEPYNKKELGVSAADCFQTDRGELVRSKSELIIANLLAHENIPYRYECPRRLRGIGVIYPDFTVLSPHTGKEIYWEHQGRMDDPDYAEKAVRRTLWYTQNGILPGDRLLLTSETGNCPINVQQIKDLIKLWFIP